jgi:hypothetical protein
MAIETKQTWQQQGMKSEHQRSAHLGVVTVEVPAQVEARVESSE